MQLNVASTSPALATNGKLQIPNWPGSTAMKMLEKQAAAQASETATKTSSRRAKRRQDSSPDKKQAQNTKARKLDKDELSVPEITGAPTSIPAAAEVTVPSGGLRPEMEVEGRLHLGMDQPPQIVKIFVAAAQLQNTSLSAAPPGSQVQLTLNDKSLFRVLLRGGRVQWVNRKKYETIMRNRRSAAASRQSIVDMKKQIITLTEKLATRDATIEDLKRRLVIAQKARGTAER